MNGGRGVLLPLALLLLAGALLLWPPSGRPGAARLRQPPAGRRAGASPSTTAADATDGEDPVRATRRRGLLSAGAGCAAAVLLGGPIGMATGLVVAAVSALLLRAADDGREATRQALERDLPVACDLVAVCLAAGVPVSGALAAVGASLPAPLGAHLRSVARLYRLGAEPRRAWAEVPAELAALGRAMVRAGESGSAVVPALGALATDRRAAARGRTEAAVRRAGVWVLAPLGLCFLPAFVCLGVVPLVLGIAGEVFG